MTHAAKRRPKRTDPAWLRAHIMQQWAALFSARCLHLKPETLRSLPASYVNSCCVFNGRISLTARLRNRHAANFASTSGSGSGFQVDPTWTEGVMSF